MAGRGVDIILGGNPEGLARETTIAEGLDPTSDEGRARYAALLVKFKASCAEEATQVVSLGGLYVLGSERHESRRIDNQLRGRSGRQGDPGESRFYLSLEDELMRIFATGAMNWVMERALPEDVPIEARMVTRAIEKAQATVEQRNAEIRKDVLKYDEVMNEQRKVIYERRMQVIDGDDLRERTLELLEEKVAELVATCCPNEFSEEWDLERLVSECAQYYPTAFSVADLAQATSTEQLVDSIYGEASEYYEAREQTFPGGVEAARDFERQIMLQIIDQRWRYHLAEMDYLREGIHLRSLAQTDPLVAWQREGFEMFGMLMEGIDDDYLRYVMHVQVIAVEETAPDYRQATYEAAADPVNPVATTLGEEPVAVAAGTASTAARGSGAPARAAYVAGTRPASAKLGRNEPCWCGSGRKYKLCHGAG
jgi:preprotein translocase subunit SecA